MNTKRIIDSDITLIPYYPNYDVTYEWYQDLDVCKQVDNIDHTYTMDRLEAMYNFLSTYGECFYIEYQGVLVGDITLRDNNEVCIVICKEYQNKHIGRRCVQEIILLAKEKGLSKIKANIYSFNHQSRKMFLSVGFLQISEEWFVLPLEDYSEISIETKDLYLKKLKYDDWKDLYENISRHDESAKYMLWKVIRNEEEAKAQIKKAILYEKTEKYALGVFLKETDTAIGWATMKEIEPGIYGEDGIAIGPAFTGKGYGKQILNALVLEAKKCGAKEFQAGARTNNLASHYLQMSCGFKFHHYSEEKEDPKNGEKYIIEYNRKLLV